VLHSPCLPEALGFSLRAAAASVRDYEWWLHDKSRGSQQKAHQHRRSAFSAYLFQVIGNKHVLLACIQHPICSAAQAAAVIGSAAQPA